MFLFLFHNLDICEFNNLSLRCALLDEILAIPESPERESVFEYETLALKEARGIIYCFILLKV